jgi:hypothetical protein
MPGVGKDRVGDRDECVDEYLFPEYATGSACWAGYSPRYWTAIVTYSNTKNDASI